MASMLIAILNVKKLKHEYFRKYLSASCIDVCLLPAKIWCDLWPSFEYYCLFHICSQTLLKSVIRDLLKKKFVGKKNVFRELRLYILWYLEDALKFSSAEQSPISSLSEKNVNLTTQSIARRRSRGLLSF